MRAPSEKSQREGVNADDAIDTFQNPPHWIPYDMWVEFFNEYWAERLGSEYDSYL